MLLNRIDTPLEFEEKNTTKTVSLIWFVHANGSKDTIKPELRGYLGFVTEKEIIKQGTCCSTQAHYPDSSLLNAACLPEKQQISILQSFV